MIFDKSVISDYHLKKKLQNNKIFSFERHNQKYFLQSKLQVIDFSHCNVIIKEVMQ